MDVLKLIFIALTFNFSAYAQTLQSPRIFVFHINGVNTVFADARENLDNLMAVSGVKSNIINWDVLFNPSHGLLASDLWVTLLQKRHENKNLSIDDYVIAYMKAYNLHYKPGSQEYKNLKENIKDLYRKDPSFVGRNLDYIVDQFHEKTSSAFTSIKNLLAEYKNKKDVYVLLLPHSQGNLYANELWDYLVHAENFPASHLALFGIANPADKIKGTVEIPKPNHGDPSKEQLIKYITAKDDFVINSLRIFSYFLPETNQPMPSNVGINCYDSLCHSLIEAYLYDNHSKIVISEKINLLIISLKLKMIEEEFGESIRLLFDLPAYVGNTNEIISPTGKIICSANACDTRIIGYINPMSCSDFDPYFYNTKFLFKETQEPGSYLYISDRSMQLIIRGNIQSAMSYNYNVDQCSGVREIDEVQIEEDKSSPFYGKLYAEMTGKYKKDCSLSLPEIYYKNKLIIGKFAVF